MVWASLGDADTIMWTIGGRNIPAPQMDPAQRAGAGEAPCDLSGTGKGHGIACRGSHHQEFSAIRADRAGRNGRRLFHTIHAGVRLPYVPLTRPPGSAVAICRAKWCLARTTKGFLYEKFDGITGS